ncbi:MAG: hypothetical protein HUU21_04035 [Polyangiaceae bacterium]|nr:hypothetical protein [Polyangiaceae bacterium]NUQ72704.1 hypothetical protein [Polyangiaceae bacterium]
MGTLVCTIELDKQAGVTVKVENADGKITQTIVMDGTAITITVKGESDTSTITQKADSVVIKCKKFEVDATETITMKSTKASTYQSDDTMTLKSTKDMSLTSDADIKASAMNIKGDAKTEVALTGANTQKLSLASAGATLSSTSQLSLEGKAQASMKGGMVEVKATGMLNAEASGVATLKGSLTNVQGSLVNLG